MCCVCCWFIHVVRLFIVFSIFPHSSSLFSTLSTAARNFLNVCAVLAFVYAAKLHRERERREEGKESKESERWKEKKEDWIIMRQNGRKLTWIKLTNKTKPIPIYPKRIAEKKIVSQRISPNAKKSVLQKCAVYFIYKSICFWCTQERTDFLWLWGEDFYSRKICVSTVYAVCVCVFVFFSGYFNSML